MKPYLVEISGRAIRWKPWAALLCTLMATKRKGEGVPDPERSLSA